MGGGGGVVGSNNNYGNYMYVRMLEILLLEDPFLKNHVELSLSLSLSLTPSLPNHLKLLHNRLYICTYMYTHVVHTYSQ